MLSYADEKDPEYALKFKADTKSIDQANARAKILQRRLNACCKGLIESKPMVGRPLADAQVGHLHRTVKDYVEREDNWSRFLAMTDGPFNPYTRLCNTHIVKLKISDRHIFDGDYRGNLFWGRITCAMQYATRADPGCATGLQTKLLNKLDVATSHLAALKNTRGKSFIDEYHKRYVSWVRIGHWSATNINSCLNQTFLHLAVQCQLFDYVRAVLPSHASQIDTLTLALLISVTGTKISHFGSFFHWRKH